MAYFFWWIRQSLLVLIAGFFLFFGISLFRGAYTLKDPFFFIMTIFASNLFILISATLLIGFILRMYNTYKLKKNGSENNGISPDDKDTFNS